MCVCVCVSLRFLQRVRVGLDRLLTFWLTIAAGSTSRSLVALRSSHQFKDEKYRACNLQTTNEDRKARRRWW